MTGRGPSPGLAETGRAERTRASSPAAKAEAAARTGLESLADFDIQTDPSQFIPDPDQGKVRAEVPLDVHDLLPLGRQVGRVIDDQAAGDPFAQGQPGHHFHGGTHDERIDADPVHAEKPGGAFLVKAFQGEGFDEFCKMLETKFKSVSATKPKSSRPNSREMYVYCRGFRAVQSAAGREKNQEKEK